MQEILEVLKETAIDSIKLLPFLFITYLIMEYIEHKTSNKVKQVIQKSGKFGPLLGNCRNSTTMWIFCICNKFIFSKSNNTWNTYFSIFNNI